MAAGVVLTAAGLLYPGFPDRYVLARLADARCAAYDHAMLKLSETWSNEVYLEASVPVVACGDERAFTWFESATKAMAVSEAVVTPLKYVVGRRRPDGELDRKNSSFPSSHASSAFAFATTLTMHYPRLGPKAFEVAFFVSISRVYLARHYPSDVIAGAAVGLAAAVGSEIYLSWLRFERRALLDSLLRVLQRSRPPETGTPLFGKPSGGPRP